MKMIAFLCSTCWHTLEAKDVEQPHAAIGCLVHLAMRHMGIQIRSGPGGRPGVGVRQV